MKPSEVMLFKKSWIPLTDTMGRVEREVAAAFIVQTCIANGDEWQPVTWKQIGKAMVPALS